MEPRLHPTQMERAAATMPASAGCRIAGAV